MALTNKANPTEKQTNKKTIYRQLPFRIRTKNQRFFSPVFPCTPHHIIIFTVCQAFHRTAVQRRTKQLSSKLFGNKKRPALADLFYWRRHPDLNWGSGFCRPMPYHLAMTPSHVTEQLCNVPFEPHYRLPIKNGADDEARPLNAPAGATARTRNTEILHRRISLARRVFLSSLIIGFP